jgi:hypothetical protein
LLDDSLMLVQKLDVDYRNLNGSPSPEEFFLLSRVKGSVTVGQVCSVSGLGREKTIAALERLIEYGLLVAGNTNEPGPRESRATSLKPNPSTSAVAQPAPARQPTPIAQPTAKPKPAVDPRMLDDDDDLFGAPAAPAAPATPAPAAPQPAAPKQSHSSFASVIAPDATDLFESGSVALGGRAGVSGRPATSPSPPIASTPAVQKTAVAHAAPAMATQTTASPPQAPTDYSDLFGEDGHIDIEPSEPIALAPRVSLFDDGEPAAPTLAPAVKPEKPDALSLSRFPITWDDFIPDPELMNLDVEIDEDRKREILHMFANIGLMTHYDLFGAAQDDDRRAFKQAYFALSKRYHPDMFFRKNVGEFGVRVESIFKTVTKAFQTLQNPQKRAEYDRSISAESGMGLDRPSEVTEHDPESKREAAFGILLRRGEKLELAGAYSEAVDEYRKALALNREVALILRCAILLLRAGVRLDEAAMYARALLAYDPNHLEGLVVLGSIYERNEMLEDALESYERALHVSGGDASVRIHVERTKAELSQR